VVDRVEFEMGQVEGGGELPGDGGLPGSGDPDDDDAVHCRV